MSVLAQLTFFRIKLSSSKKKQFSEISIGISGERVQQSFDQSERDIARGRGDAQLTH